LAVVFDSLRIVKPIPIVAKDLLVVATNNDVVKASFEFRPWFYATAACTKAPFRIVSNEI
jgi:hypothetical protein